MSTLRNVCTCILPSNFGASGIHAAWGLTPFRLRKKFPTPKSVNAAPAALRVNPYESGTF
jgi:hypothetical protein